MRIGGRAVVLGLLGLACSAPVRTTSYQGYQIQLYGPPVTTGSAKDPFAATVQFQVTLSYFEDAQGQKPYGQELGGNPPGFSGFQPTSTATFPGTDTTLTISQGNGQIALPRVNGGEQPFYISAEILGLNANMGSVARAKCPLMEVQEDPSGSLPPVTCNAFYGMLGQWNLVAPMNEARADFAAVALPDGRIVVAGGRPPGLAVRPSNTGSMAAPIQTIEVYEPVTDGGTSGTWSVKAVLSQARYGLTGTYTPDGHVVFVGGLTVTQPASSPDGGTKTGCAGTLSTDPNPCEEIPVSTIDVFDTTSDSVVQANNMLPNSEVRGEHAASLLGGTTVLVAGGVGLASEGDVLAPALDFLALQLTPTVMTESLNNTDIPRQWPCLVPISSGEQLLCSGTSWTNGVPSGESCEVIGPAGTSMSAPVMGMVPRTHTQCGVIGSSVFLAGGDIPMATSPSGIEVWSNGSLSHVVNEPAVVDGDGLAATNGQIVVAGGYNPSLASNANDPSTWAPGTYWFAPGTTQTPVVSTNLQFPRAGFQLLGLPDGTAMAIGGAVSAPSTADGGVPVDPGAEILPVPDP